MKEGWKYIKLGEIIHIKHGYGFKGEFFVEEPNNNFLLTPGNFAIGGGFKSDKMKYYEGPINDEFILSAGDVLVTMTDLSKQADTLGYSAKIPNDPENTYLHNQRLGLVSLKTNDFDIDYIYWLLRTQYYQKYIAGSSSGATVKHTSPKKIYSTKLLVPESKETQIIIASILSAYDDLIENNLKRIKLLEEKAQLTYEEWFVRMKFPGHEATATNKETGLPEGWEQLKLTDIYSIKYGKNLPQTKIQSSGEYPVYGASGIMGFYSGFNCDSKVVLVTSRGNGSGEVHRTYENKTFVTNNSFVVKPKKEFNNISLGFSFEFLRVLDLTRYCSGSAQPQLTNSAMLNIKVKLPSMELLLKYKSISEDLIAITDDLKVQNQLLKEARDILLPRLMTGMIDVDHIQLENQQPTNA